jgi:hypothetical protein
MGGAVVMAASVEKDPPIADGIVLVAPAVWGLQTQSGFNRNVLDLAAKTVPWMTVVPTGLRLRASSSNAALIAMARDPLVIKETIRLLRCSARKRGLNACAQGGSIPGDGELRVIGLQLIPSFDF